MYKFEEIISEMTKDLQKQIELAAEKVLQENFPDFKGIIDT